MWDRALDLWGLRQAPGSGKTELNCWTPAGAQEVGEVAGEEIPTVGIRVL